MIKNKITYFVLLSVILSGCFLLPIPNHTKMWVKGDMVLESKEEKTVIYNKLSIENLRQVNSAIELSVKNKKIKTTYISSEKYKQTSYEKDVTYYEASGLYQSNSEMTGNTKEDIIEKHYKPSDKVISQEIISASKEPYAPVHFDTRYFTLKGKETILETDANGDLIVIIESFPANWISSGQNLENRIREIKEDNLTKKIRNTCFDKDSEPIIIETAYEGDDNNIVKNDKQTLEVSGFVANPNCFQSVIKEFVKNRVNKKTNYISLKLRDIDSHVSIPDASVAINAKQKDIISTSLNKYFRGETLSLAKSFVEDDADYSSTQHTDYNGVVTFKVHLPSTYDINITHQEYHYIEKTIRLDQNSKNIIIDMSQLGKKVRVRITNH